MQAGMCGMQSCMFSEVLDPSNAIVVITALHPPLAARHDDIYVQYVHTNVIAVL
jgi:hypothetical protein